MLPAESVAALIGAQSTAEPFLYKHLQQVEEIKEFLHLKCNKDIYGPLKLSPLMMEQNKKKEKKNKE